MGALGNSAKFFRAPGADAQAGAPRVHGTRPGTAIFAVLFAAFALEVFAHTLHLEVPENKLPSDLASVAALLTLLAPGIYLVVRTQSSNSVRTTIVLSTACIIGSQLLNLTANMPYFNSWPVLGTGMAFHDMARWGLLVVGLVLTLASLYLALIEMGNTKAALLLERGELLREVMVRQRAEEALVERENIYRSAITEAGAIPYRIDWQTKTYQFYGADAFRLTGYTQEELTFDIVQSMPLEIRFLGPLAGLTHAEVTRLIRGGALRNWHAEYRIRTKQGEDKWIADSSVEVAGADGAIVETIGMFQDITERKREEEAVIHNERYFRALIGNTSDLITVLNQDGTIRYISPSVENIFGYAPDSLSGMSIFDLVHPDDRAHTTNAFTLGIECPSESHSVQFRCRHKDGSYRMLESVGRSLLDDPDVRGAIVNSRDITDRMQLEHQLAQSQKMDGIGRLAGGVAHDFNNLLTCIMGYCELAMARAPKGERLYGQIEQILQATHRAAELTRQLLAFARKQIIEPRNTNLNALTLNLGKMLQRLIREDIELITMPSEDPAIVRIDPGQFEQVVINLAVNARDAMPDGGKITIEIKHVALGKDYAKHHPDVRPGEYVMLAISDTGHGMTEEVRARVFEPFFTTKESGKGTGLGLAMCYGIVRQAGGHIWVYSEPGQGSTFKIYLPRAEGSHAHGSSELQSLPPAGGSETVLLVEDEPLVRSIALQVLVDRGYSVIEAQDGPAALALAEEHDGPIDLLLTDVVMPRMSGRELAAELQAIRPEIKVLYMSGYTEDAIVHRGVLDRGIAFLPKPFTPDALAGKVRKVLDEQSEPALA